MSRFDSLIEELRAEIDAAYKRGFEAGALDMRDRILNAAQGGPVTPPEHPRAQGSWTIVTSARAPRGAVGRLLAEVLADHPGLTTTEIELIAGDYDKGVATKSIGNELRRFQGMKYRRDDSGKWFLIGGDAAETEAPAESSAGDLAS